MNPFELHYVDGVLLIERDGRVEQGYYIPDVNPAAPVPLGRIGAGHAWALNRRGVLHLIDVEAGVDRIATEAANPALSGRSYVVAAGDGASLFLIGPGEGGLVLQTIEVAKAAVSHRYLIGCTWGHYRDAMPVLAADGKVLLPVQRKGASGEMDTGIVSVDPWSGEREEMLIPAERYGVGMMAISPDGRYCLRPDLTLLPSDRGGALQSWFGLRKERRRFGLTMQLWQTQPLKFVRRLTIGWFEEDDLPQSARGDLFGVISEVTKRLALEPQRRARQIDFPQPYANSAKDWDRLESEWREFATGMAMQFAWTADSQGFWHVANGLVALTMVDGRSSPRMLLGRFGYSANSTRASTVYPLQIEPLAGQRVRLTYSDGRAVIAGTVAAMPGARFAIGPGSDAWEKTDAEVTGRRYREAAEVRRRARLVAIPLASLEEADCIAAIDALRQAVQGNFLDRVVDDEILIEFVMPGRVLGEGEFFEMVEAHSPRAAGALRGLIEALCAVPGIEKQHLFSVGEEGIGLLSGAARAFAKLDPAPIELVKAYGRLMDVEHEYSYINSVVPSMLENLGWTPEVMDFAVWLIQANFYNSMDHRRLWEEWGMGRAAAARYRPEEFGFGAGEDAGGPCTRADGARHRLSLSHSGYVGAGDCAEG